MSVELSLDRASAARLNQQMDRVRRMGPNSVYSAMVAVSLQVVNFAKLRLKGRSHIVTSRLRNSIWVKTKRTPRFQYSDKYGKTFVGQLVSVPVSGFDLAIGTDVEYAQKIEDRDSFLNWALNNVDIEKQLTDLSEETLENAMIFGQGIINIQPQQ
jgi:hypothetical protein